MRHAARTEAGAEEVEIPLVDGQQREAEDQRQRDPQRSTEVRVVQREAQANSHAPYRIDEGRTEGAEQGAGENAPGEALDPQRRPEQNAPKDDADVVDQRR